MRKDNSKKYLQHGFTLVELVVVIAILGILAAVAVPNYMNYQHRSRVSTDIATSKEIIRQIRIKEIEKGAKYDTSDDVQNAMSEFNFSSSSKAGGDEFSLMASGNADYTVSLVDGKINISFNASNKKAGKYGGDYTVTENEGVTKGNSYFIGK